jgi:hypothetical protein
VPMLGRVLPGVATVQELGYGPSAAAESSW